MALQLTGNLRRGSQRIVLSGDRANTHAGVEGDECLWAVRQCDCHGVSRANTRIKENAGGAQHLVMHLGIGESLAEVVQGDAARVETSGGIQ